MMNLISDGAPELLRNAPCPLSVFDVLSKMAPLRQREAAVLMPGKATLAAHP